LETPFGEIKFTFNRILHFNKGLSFD